MNRAQRALDSVQRKPRAALRLARELLDDPDATVHERASAAWALGRAYSELDQVEEALTSLEAGLATAQAAGLDALAADIRVSLSVCLLTAGDTSGARAQLQAAEPDLASDESRGRHVMQWGFVELHLGDLQAALGYFDRAAPLLRDGGDELALARLLVNRGVASTMVGDIERGEQDFLDAREAAERLGQLMLGAGAAQNLGFVAGRKGDTPAALRWFAEARAAYRELGSPRRLMATLDSDLSTVLLSGGLYREAAVAAERAARMTARTGNRLGEAEALLLLARAHLADRSFADAERQARSAASIFEQSEREAWVALADYIGLQAAARGSPASGELLDRAIGIAERLAGLGWRRESLEVRTFAGRTALALGRLDQARVQLEQPAGIGGGSSTARANASLARAALHLAGGDRQAAKRSLSAGMGTIEDHRASLAATELRAHASAMGAELAELGLQLAAEDGEPAEVLRWAERWHAGGLQAAPVRAEPSSRLARALIELRRVHVAAADGGSSPAGRDRDVVIAALEREIRDLSRASESSGSAAAAPLDVDELCRRLAGDTLVEYFTTGGRLHAIVVAAGAVTTQPLGEAAELEHEVRRITSALSRLAHAGAGPAALEATGAALAATAATVDELLLGKLCLPGTGDVVIVPTGCLQWLPWPVLPSLALRAVTVTPSGWLWAQPRASHQHPRSTEQLLVLLVCGRNLPGGEQEIRRLRRLYREPTVLTGRQATVPAVLAAMEHADLVHLAAHGTFRADNPMFSSLHLHDGPLTVYDLESLTSPPSTVILPACDAARPAVQHGDELLGTASALLQVGVGTVIAPLTAVSDAAVVPLMFELHRQILAGWRPDHALVRARQSVGRDHAGSEPMAAASFVSVGTSAASHGWVPAGQRWGGTGEALSGLARRRR